MTLEALRSAEEKAQILFEEIHNCELIKPGKTEKELNVEIYNLAYKLFGIKKYWHKRIVRSGKNTLLPYQHNPPDLTLTEDDILFVDFGPVFEQWEADFGRTYVIGSNPRKHQLKADIENAWQEGKEYAQERKFQLTGAELYNYTKKLANKYGWEFGNIHAGHLIGEFPHERVQGEDEINYIHPNNQTLMSDPDKFGNQRFWIYEIHFIDPIEKIGGFFEQLIH